MSLDPKVQNALKYLVTSIKPHNIGVFDDLKIIKSFKIINEKGITYSSRDLRDCLQKLACSKSLETKILDTAHIIQLSYAIEDNTEGNEYYDADYRTEFQDRWLKVAISNK